MEPTHIEHPLEPVFDARSRVLVLGTMPSPKSREAGFYYAHPQNRFWKVMGALFGEPEPLGNEARTSFMLERRIALWDVLASCTIEGAPYNILRKYHSVSGVKRELSVTGLKTFRLFLGRPRSDLVAGGFFPDCRQQFHGTVCGDVRQIGQLGGHGHRRV